jgi:hypothetical protein
MGIFRHRQDDHRTPDWMSAYLSFDLDTMELAMNAARFDALLRSHSARASRRGVLTGLAGGLLAALPLALRGDGAGAKKKHKTKKPTRNRYGCVDVGRACAGDSALCCSGICEGTKPRKGKKDKSRCVGHDSGSCLPEQDSCGEYSIACGTDARCFQTTGKGVICATYAKFDCRACNKDADCVSEKGEGAACVFCADGYACPGTGARVCLAAAI